MQYVWAITSYHDYHEPELQDFACELPGFGEANQRWFLHEHLGIRVCGSGASTTVVAIKTSDFMRYLLQEVHHRITSGLRGGGSRW